MIQKQHKAPLTILIPCHEPWDRTADFLRQTALRLSKNHSVTLILNYQGQFWLTALWQKLSRSNTVSPTALTIAHNILFSLPIWFIPGNRWKFVRECNQKIWLWWLYVQARMSHPDQKIWLWLFSPEDWLYPTALPGINSLYDCVDDHSQLNARETFRLKKQEKILIKTATIFTTNSQVLAALHHKLRNPDAIVVQGFDDALWPKSLPTVSRRARPQILLMGSLDERVDWPLVHWLTKKLPQHEFHFAGPIAARVSSFADPVLKQPNVQYHGVLPRKELHTVLSQATLCLIPYHISLPAAKHSFPMKVLEYFAYGKPVISSDITELNLYTPYVKIAHTPEKWFKLIQAVLQKPWPKKLQTEARQIAWDHRYESKLAQILELLYKAV